MRNREIERAISEIKGPVKQAFSHLSTYAPRIRATSSKFLERYENCAPHISQLNGMHLVQRLRDLATTNVRTYRDECEQQGEDLARRGVPALCAVSAVLTVVESCLPYLMIDDPRRIKWRRALIRWASAYQFLLLAGYARYAEAERQELESRVALAERRSQDFSAELGEAYEKERRRLAQDLHDEIGHDLIVLKLYTEVIALELKKGEIPQVRRKLCESISLIKHALKGVRHLVFDLGPAVWSEQGFLSAMRLYLHQYADRTGLKVRFIARGLKTNLPPRYETALYKVLQGALSNVAAHAEAEHVQITLSNRRDRVVMKIADDGKGFNVGKKLRSQPHCFGLNAMRDRIQLLGGSIDFVSEPARRRSARRGTVIEFQLPLHDVQ